MPNVHLQKYYHIKIKITESNMVTRLYTLQKVWSLLYFINTLKGTATFPKYFIKYTIYKHIYHLTAIFVASQKQMFMKTTQI